MATAVLPSLPPPGSGAPPVVGLAEQRGVAPTPSLLSHLHPSPAGDEGPHRGQKPWAASGGRACAPQDFTSSPSSPALDEAVPVGARWPALRRGSRLPAVAFGLVQGCAAAPLLLEFVDKLAGGLAPGGSRALEDLALDSEVESGLFSAALRACDVLGFVSVDALAGTCRASGGEEFCELTEVLKPGSPVAKALRNVHSAMLRGGSPSDLLGACLEAWGARRAWAGSRALGLVLDGAVLTPLLAAVGRFAAAGRRLDLGGLGRPLQAGLEGVLDELLDLGEMDSAGRVGLTPRGWEELWSFCGTLAPLAPLLPVPCGPPSAPPGVPAAEVPDGAQHVLCMPDLLRQVRAVFNAGPFKAQPRFLVAAGEGAGALLAAVRKHVQRCTQRGALLDAFPLTAVAVAADKAQGAALKRANQQPWLKVVVGGTGSAEQLLAALAKARAPPQETLVLATLLCGEELAAPPRRPLDEASTAGAFARGALGGLPNLGPEGRPTSPCAVFAALVERLEDRFGPRLGATAGLCCQDPTALSSRALRQSFARGAPLCGDLAHGLGGGALVPAPALALAAAMAGLVPDSVELLKEVSARDAGAGHCAALSQCLKLQPFRIRLAEQADYPELMALEQQCWAPNLRATELAMRARLRTTPETVLVATKEDGRLVAALWMQRIDEETDVLQMQYEGTHLHHRPSGKLVQLLAIASSEPGVGNKLRNFALHLACLDPAVEGVVAVTRASDFRGGGPAEMEDYIDRVAAGHARDGTVTGFHMDAGARVRFAVPNYRHKDVANFGYGVLIRYNILDRASLGRPLLQPAPVAADDQGAHGEEAAPLPGGGVRGLIEGLCRKLAPEDDITQPFMDFLDSMEVSQLSSMIGTELGRRLNPTVVLDYPSVELLSAHLEETAVSRARASKGCAG
ncbi:unnamed protein product [Prorocentrum cordatum]|uniref:Polyketide synthase-like phosphopantetheine-binding domain-containing protein n=1 Tax=Prorocentrum cordatum TaxID=2364126 RepID=A0ABN9WQ11_9DINO|nr:unnamed protein product [Polarella glacialis]